MNLKPWQFILGGLLIGFSGLLYFLHFLIFRDAHHIFIYLLGDIAFLPIDVLLVAIILHSILEGREKNSRLEKMNMIIGVFFSEIGNQLLSYFSDLDPNLTEIKGNLLIRENWTGKEFSKVEKNLKKHIYSINAQKVDLNGLKDYLASKRDFLLRILENPNLLEHEMFTDLLQSVFHITEELVNRKTCTSLHEKDCMHLENDIARAYRLLVIQWIEYMKHLKGNYPFLFSLAMRTNPFDQTAEIFIK